MTVEELKAALKWVLDSGLYHNSIGNWEDPGCGCCAGTVNQEKDVPANFRKIFKELADE